MLTIWRLFVVTLAAAAAASSSAVNADSYRAKGLAFEISSISEGDLEDRIAAALIEPGIGHKETHPVVQIWVTPPCIEIAERVPGTESTLLSIIDTIHLRSNVRLPLCSLGSSAVISYFFASDLDDPNQRSRLITLFARENSPSEGLKKFVDGRSDCYWRHKSSGEGNLSLLRAMVAANTSAMDDSQLERCLFLGTVISLGIPNPFVLLSDSSITNTTAADWRKEEEAMFLAVYVLYSLEESETRGNKEQIHVAVRKLLRSMRKEGAL